MGFGGIQSAQNTINTTSLNSEQSLSEGAIASQQSLQNTAVSGQNEAEQNASAAQQSLFGGENSLVALQNNANTLGANEQATAEDIQGASLDYQANFATEYAGQQALLQQNEVNVTAANQEEGYLSGGVQLSGSPLAVVNTTRAIGQMQVDSIYDQGQLQSQVYQEQALQAVQAGQADELDAEGQNAVNSANNSLEQGQQQEELEQQNLQQNLSLSEQGESNTLSLYQQGMQQYMGLQQQGQQANLQISIAKQQEEMSLLTLGLAGGSSAVSAGIGNPQITSAIGSLLPF